MKAKDARKLTDAILASGVQAILDKIKEQARLGKYYLVIDSYTTLNDICRAMLMDLGYTVKWNETQREDGYWKIEW